MNEFGNYLYILRKRKGMTQQDLADKLNITNKAVSKWETGEAYPETAQLVPLADIFGVTVDDLLRGNDKEPQEANDAVEVSDDGEQKTIEINVVKKRRSRYQFARKFSSVIMTAAIAIYLILGFVFELWHPGWVIFPVSALLCGMVSTIVY